MYRRVSGVTAVVTFVNKALAASIASKINLASGVAASRRGTELFLVSFEKDIVREMVAW